MNNYTEYSFSDNLKVEGTTAANNEERVQKPQEQSLQVSDPEATVAEPVNEPLPQVSTAGATASANSASTEKAAQQPKLKNLHLGWLFLIPAAILLVYDILVAADVLPVWIYFNHYRVKLLRITENGLMTTISLVAFVVLPLIGLIMTVRRRNYNLSVSQPDDESANEYNPIFVQNTETTTEEEKVSEVTEPTPTAVSDAQTSSDGELVEYFYSLLNLADTNARAADYKSVEYTKNPTLKNIVEDFSNFAKSKGLTVPENSARAIFSAMASSKLLYVVGVKDRKLARRMAITIAEYFGSDLHIEGIRQDVKSPVSLAVRKARNEEYYVESEFLVDVYSANHCPSAVRFAALDSVNSVALSDYFGEYMDGIDVATRERYATIATATGKTPEYVRVNKMKLPSNVWYFIIPTDETVYSNIPEAAMPLAFFGISYNEEGVTAPAEHMLLSADSVMNAARNVKENYFIPEEYWKKIDLVEEYIAKRCKFVIDNKTIRRMESYAAVSLAAGATVYEAVDGALAGKVLPALAHCDKDSLLSEEDSISALIDRVFGLDNMPLSQELLRRLGVA